MEKRYVKVMLEIDEDGKKTPTTIVFNDEKFEIEKVLDVKIFNDDTRKKSCRKTYIS